MQAEQEVVLLPGSNANQAHATLLARLTVEKPNRNRYRADAHDLEDRSEHIAKILGATLEYVAAIVSDTAYVAPAGMISEKHLRGLVEDVASDVAHFIWTAASIFRPPSIADPSPSSR